MTTTAARYIMLNPIEMTVNRIFILTTTVLNILTEATPVRVPKTTLEPARMLRLQEVPTIITIEVLLHLQEVLTAITKEELLRLQEATLLKAENKKLLPEAVHRQIPKGTPVALKEEIVLNLQEAAPALQMHQDKVLNLQERHLPEVQAHLPNQEAGLLRLRLLKIHHKEAVPEVHLQKRQAGRRLQVANKVRLPVHQADNSITKH